MERKLTGQRSRGEKKISFAGIGVNNVKRGAMFH